VSPVATTLGLQSYTALPLASPSRREFTLAPQPPPARRIRSGSIRLALWVSAFAFLIIESYALQEQLEIGHASVMFMLGTALLGAGICIALFAVIAAVGLVASVFFSEQQLGDH